jgi:hypothetical protein
MAAGLGAGLVFWVRAGNGAWVGRDGEGVARRGSWRGPRGGGLRGGVVAVVLEGAQGGGAFRHHGLRGARGGQGGSGWKGAGEGGRVGGRETA